ncbi:hypothetical protein LAZ67_20000818 [Cordylochernes scorpioides]|uniref:BTB domain-containing protein n=1 Tax=Cordylochernes scorpioides TaxID=51811 RepID=A0ABY6LJL6_9ARAC|nr:hypothetical protein LAZ67_20000818 [Cordylochernes scorpioides]
MEMQQQFCLKWNNHHSNMLAVFESLLSTESLVDVTLACEGKTMKAHKIVLSACSPFFLSLFEENPCKHPIVILKDMQFTELRAIITFMYKGEVNVSQEHLATLLRTAETLKIKGLAEVSHPDGLHAERQVEAPQNPAQQASPDLLLHNKRRKKGRPRKRSFSGSNKSDEEPLTNRLKETSSEIDDTTDDFDHQGPSANACCGNSVHNSAEPIGLSAIIPQNSIDPQSGEEDFEPTRLMEQTLTTENVSFSQSFFSSYSDPLFQIPTNNTGSRSSPKSSTTKSHTLPSGTLCVKTEANDSQVKAENEERPGAPPKFEDEELEARLDQDPTQTQKELTKTLEVMQPAIFHRLKEMGMIQKVGNLVPYELKPRDVERHFYMCEQLLQRQKRKGFLHRIVTGDEKWVHYNNPKHRSTYGYPGHASSSTAKPNIHDGLSFQVEARIEPYNFPGIVSTPEEAPPHAILSTPQYDNSDLKELISDKELFLMFRRGQNARQFAVNIAKAIFTPHEMRLSNCRGAREKLQLNEEKLKFIRKAVLKYYDIAPYAEYDIWKICCQSIDAHCRHERRLFRRQAFQQAGDQTIS